MLIHVIDRSSPVWKKQRETVIRELDGVGCEESIVVELWNKIDNCPHPEKILEEVKNMPLDVDGYTDVILGNEYDRNELYLDDNNNNNNYSEEDEFALLKDGMEVPTSSTSTSDSDSQKDLKDISNLKKNKKDMKKRNRKTYIVAASALTGLNFDGFVSTLEDALSSLLIKMHVFIPYDKDDGIIASIHSQGAVDLIEYHEKGTSIICRIPSTLVSKLEKWKVNE